MKPVRDVVAAIGRTPLIKLRAASEATGCTILGKAEFMNPGGIFILISFSYHVQCIRPEKG